MSECVKEAAPASGAQLISTKAIPPLTCAMRPAPCRGGGGVAGSAGRGRHSLCPQGAYLQDPGPWASPFHFWCSSV